MLFGSMGSTSGSSLGSMKGGQAQAGYGQNGQPYAAGIQQSPQGQGLNAGLYNGMSQTGQGFQGNGMGYQGFRGPMTPGSSQMNPSNPALGNGMRTGPVQMGGNGGISGGSSGFQNSPTNF